MEAHVWRQRRAGDAGRAKQAPGEPEQRPDVPAELLEGYPELLASAARTGRRPTAVALDRQRAHGARAAELGIAISRLVRAHLAATEAAWPGLPGVADAPTATDLRGAGLAVLAAVTRSIAAIVEGHEAARRLAVHRDAQARREFVDDLLYGRTDQGRLAERAERFGVLLSGGNVVAVARAPEAFAADDPLADRVRDALENRFGGRNVLVAVRDGLLVCIMASALRGVAGELAHQLLRALGTDSGWQVGVGRPRSGPAGVVRSFEEARNALHLAERLQFGAPVLHAADLLVFPVLLRDRAAITDLVLSVLGPLEQAKGGARPMLDTLAAFFSCHGNHTATARRLDISTRAVTYRLERIRRLIGYTPTEPTQRFTLEAAVLGARLLDWPDQPLSAP